MAKLAVKTRQFTGEFCRDVVYGDAEGAKVISDTIYETSRWSVLHELIFEYEGKIYRTGYSEGATEMQDESPFEYDTTVECDEVEAREVLVTQYFSIPLASGEMKPELPTPKAPSIKCEDTL